MLSRHVAELETQLGTPSFDRTGRGLTPTAAALAIANAARSMQVDQGAYGWLVAEGAGIGFVVAYNLAHWSGVEAVLPHWPSRPCPAGRRLKPAPAAGA